MKKIKTVIDIDGCLADLVCVWNSIINKKLHPCHFISKDDIVQYNILDVLINKGVSKSVVDDIFNDFKTIDYGYFENVKKDYMFNHICDFLKNIRHESENIIYSKYLSNYEREDKIKWLNKYVDPTIIDDVIIESIDKNNGVKKINADIMIDDSPNNIIEFLKNNKNSKALVVKQNWNKHNKELINHKNVIFIADKFLL